MNEDRWPSAHPCVLDERANEQRGVIQNGRVPGDGGGVESRGLGEKRVYGEEPTTNCVYRRRRHVLSEWTLDVRSHVRRREPEAA